MVYFLIGDRHGRDKTHQGTGICALLHTVNFLIAYNCMEYFSDR